MRAEQVILGSVLSEKSFGLTENRTYTLKVAVKATKEDIRNALKEVFGVEAKKINTVITRGDETRRNRTKRGGLVWVKKANEKKAYVQLKGQDVLPTATAEVEPSLPEQA